MNTIEIVASAKGELSNCIFAEGARIASLGDFLDLMANCPTNTMILRKADLPPAFFDLKTGVAGEYLQKISNYRRRLILVGDFKAVKGRAFADFVRESNRTGQVVFAPDIPGGIELLK